MEVTAAKAWAAIEGMFASQSRARLICTRMALATASKGTSSISEYFTKMKGLADDMVSAGQRLEDEELVSYILTGLDLEFNLVVFAVAARVEPISIGDLYTQLVSFKQRMELHVGGSDHQ
ncbi:uncharacterized protein [Miscanthus floridulus]|uniref:uncharacterized protein n=1 Tax=Miscanthus floridulus TaxID=154761 RepID=UPI003457F5B5